MILKAVIFNPETPTCDLDALPSLAVADMDQAPISPEGLPDVPPLAVIAVDDDAEREERFQQARNTPIGMTIRAQMRVTPFACVRRHLHSDEYPQSALQKAQSELEVSTMCSLPKESNCLNWGNCPSPAICFANSPTPSRLVVVFWPPSSLKALNQETSKHSRNSLKREGSALKRQEFVF